eukprot:4247777-Amphidinium_carterae.1
MLIFLCLLQHSFRSAACHHQSHLSSTNMLRTQSVIKTCHNSRPLIAVLSLRMTEIEQSFVESSNIIIILTHSHPPQIVTVIHIEIRGKLFKILSSILRTQQLCMFILSNGIDIWQFQHKGSLSFNCELPALSGLPFRSRAETTVERQTNHSLLSLSCLHGCGRLRRIRGWADRKGREELRHYMRKSPARLRSCAASSSTAAPENSARRNPEEGHLGSQLKSKVKSKEVHPLRAALQCITIWVLTVSS